MRFDSPVGGAVGSRGLSMMKTVLRDMTELQTSSWGKKEKA